MTKLVDEIKLLTTWDQGYHIALILNSSISLGHQRFIGMGIEVYLQDEFFGGFLMSELIGMLMRYQCKLGKRICT